MLPTLLPRLADDCLSVTARFLSLLHERKGPDALRSPEQNWPACWPALAAICGAAFASWIAKAERLS